MSDGITDSYRDQRRAECYEKFLCWLADYIENPTEESLASLKLAGEQTDRIPRGLMGGQTNIASGLENLLAKLLEGNERFWGGLLLSAHGGCPDESFRKLKKVSPFKDKIIIGVEYGIGFVNLIGEAKELFDRIIGKEQNMKIYDGDTYLAAIPKDVLKDTQIVWLKSGVSGVKGPRKAKEK